MLLDKLSDHVAEYCSNRKEPLICGANVVESIIVKQDFLHNKDGHRLGQLRARLHNTKTEWDDLGGQQKVDDLGRVILDECTNDTQRREPEILKRPRLGCGVEKWVEKERNMGWGILLVE